jgi:hypothetical protein
MGKETDECVIRNSWGIRLDSHLTDPECLVVVRLHLEEGSMYPHICENGFCSLQETSNMVEFTHVLPEGQRVHGWMVFDAIGVVVDLCEAQACSIGRLLLDQVLDADGQVLVLSHWNCFSDLSPDGLQRDHERLSEEFILGVEGFKHLGRNLAAIGPDEE